LGTGEKAKGGKSKLANVKVLLRSCTVDDLEILLAWRNLSSQGYYTQGKEKRPLTWGEHWVWWQQTQDWKRWIVQVNDGVWTRDVGQVAFRDLYAWNPEAGIYIGEITLWGQGVGKQTLQLALEWLKEQGKRYCRTTIPKDNERAIRLFESVGFVRTGEAREGEWQYQIKIV